MIYLSYNINENKLKLNKMCYISLIEKLITSFRLKKARLVSFWEGYSAMNLSLEIATALQVHKPFSNELSRIMALPIKFSVNNSSINDKRSLVLLPYK